MSHYADRFTVLVDACCLAGALRRNLLLSLAEAGFFRVRWTSRIMDETARAIDRITEGKADSSKQVGAMNRAFPDALVDEYDSIEGTIIGKFEGTKHLPDKDDAHVIASAIKCGASVIVTENVKDFNSDLLLVYGIEVKDSDDFVADCIDLDKNSAMASINKMRLRFQHPEITWEALVQRIEKQGLNQVASFMQEYSEIFSQ